MANARSKRLVATAITFAVGVTAASYATFGAVSGATENDVPAPPSPALLVVEDTPDGTHVAVLDQYGSAFGGETGLAPITITTNQRCEIVSDLSPLIGLEVLDVDRPLPLQLISSRLGGRQKGSGCTGSNARIEGGQTLTIEVGTTLAGLGYAFGSGSLNIGTYQGGGLAYSLDSGPTVSTNQLVQGQLQIDTATPFNSIELGLVESSGNFSLRSGGGPVGARTEFTLVPVGIFIDCGTSTPFGNLGDLTIEEVTFVRFEDKDGGCSPAWLRVEVEADGTAASFEGGVRDVVIIDPIGDAEQIRARVLIQWRVDRLDADGAPKPPLELNAEMIRYVQYADGEPLLYVAYCLGATGLPDDLLDPMPTAVGSVAPLVDQPWCVLADERELEGDEIVQRMIFFVNGDPKFF